MLFASFAHRLLLVFGLFVIAAVAVLAAKIGWLGELPKAWVVWALLPLQEFYAENKDDLDFAAKVVGVLGTMLGAAWTVHKGWHYAERNLPDRLNDFNARWKEDVITVRPEVAPSLAQVASVVQPFFEQPRWLRRLTLWVHDPAQKQLIKREEAVAKCKAEFDVLTSSKVRCRTELITACLALGSQIVRVSPDRGQQALDAFKKALSFNSTDLDALELAAKQAFALNLRQQACRYLNDLAEAAEGRNPIRQARALRFHAEILHGGQRADRELAREKLLAAISSLTGADARDFEVRETELALANEQLAAIQITRERFYAARTALAAAKRHFGNLSTQAAREGMGRVQDLERRLAQAEKDKENTEVQD